MRKGRHPSRRFLSSPTKKKSPLPGGVPGGGGLGVCSTPPASNLPGASYSCPSFCARICRETRMLHTRLLDLPHLLSCAITSSSCLAHFISCACVCICSKKGDMCLYISLALYVCAYRPQHTHICMENTPRRRGLTTSTRVVFSEPRASFLVSSVCICATRLAFAPLGVTTSHSLMLLPDLNELEWGSVGDLCE